MSESRGKPIRTPPPPPPAALGGAQAGVPLPAGGRPAGARPPGGEATRPPQQPAPKADAARPAHVGPARLSLTALLGAVWAPFFFLMAVLSTVQVPLAANGAPPAWLQPVQLVVIPLGWAALFATPVLGLLAIGQIQRSDGATYGLSLALFDALLFPLLFLDALVFLMSWRVATATGDTVPSVVFRQAVPTIICVLGDYFLVLRLWAMVQPPTPKRGR